MGTIRTYKATEIEAIRLNLFANICNELFVEKGMYMVIEVADIYFDYGQNWMYTSPVTYDYREGHLKTSWQTFCPRDYEIIIACDSVADMQRYADYYVEAMIDDNVCVDISAIA